MLDFIKNLFSNTKFLIILFVIAIFIAASVYVYYTYVKPRLSNVNNKEFDPYQSNSGGGNANDNLANTPNGNATLKFFYADWCPHSKKAMSIWNEVKQQFDGQIINNTLLTCEEIDGESDSQQADLYNISGFPTFKLVKSDQVIEYDAKPNIDTFKEFLNTAL